MNIIHRFSNSRGSRNYSYRVPAVVAVAGTMAVPPECNEEWFELVPNLLSHEGWEVAIDKGRCSLSHCDCPWGGHIIKCSIEDVVVKNPPEDTSCVFVRPETRERHQASCGDRFGRVELLEMLGPGEAVIKRFCSWGLLRLCTVLFGRLARPYVEFSFTSGDGACTALQKVSRDYPKKGDCAIGLFHYTGEPPEGYWSAKRHCVHAACAGAVCFPYFPKFSAPSSGVAHADGTKDCCTVDRKQTGNSTFQEFSACRRTSLHVGPQPTSSC